MIIAVDVDCVVLDTVAAVLDRYNDDYDDVLTNEDIKEFDISKFVRRECGLAIYKYFEQPEIYAEALPIENVFHGLVTLEADKHRVVFATTAAPGTAGVKQELLSKYGFLKDRKNYVECADKSLIRADILIDDAIHNLESFHGGRIIFDQPWNRSQSLFDSWRAMNWNEVIGIVRAYDAALKLAETQRILG